MVDRTLWLTGRDMTLRLTTLRALRLTDVMVGRTLRLTGCDKTLRLTTSWLTER